MSIFQFIQLVRMIYGRKELNLEAIQKMGLLAIKIGQVHALRLDFLPVEKCRELAKLYQKTTPIPSESVLEQVDQSQFKTIDKNPLASASIGQVHRAQLKDGTEVVIKVVKADFKAAFKKDVKKVKWLFRLAIFFYRKLKGVFDPIAVLEHIEDYTLRELNLLNEIEGQNTLREIYEKNKNTYGLNKLAFPKIYPELSSENVMVSEFIPGKTFDELLDHEMKYETLLKLFHIHGFYIFNIGTFHGDIHPGNLMFHDDKIYFIDTGAVSHVSSRMQHGLFDFFDKLSQYDYEHAAENLNKMAKKRLKESEIEDFKAKFKSLYADFDGTSVSEVSMTKKMMQTIKLGVKSGMRFEKSMFAIIKSMMFLDGMVIRNNPDAVLLKDMQPFMKELNDFKDEKNKT